MKTERRTALKKMFASVLGLTGIGLDTKASAVRTEVKETDSINNFKNILCI